MPSRPDSTPRHTRNPRGAGDRLRQDLMTAANRLLEGGATHESLSLRAVAREVGIAATSVYLHFPDKMSLLLAVYERHFVELINHIDQAVAQQTDPVARLRATAAAYCAFADDHPDVYRVMFMVPSVPDLPREISDDQLPGAAIIESVHEIIKDCIEAGRMPRTDPYAATLCLWAALHGIITLRTARPYVPWPPLDTLIDTLLVGSIGAT